jgi:hypothetical protein
MDVTSLVIEFTEEWMGDRHYEKAFVHRGDEHLFVIEVDGEWFSFNMNHVIAISFNKSDVS